MVKFAKILTVSAFAFLLPVGLSVVTDSSALGGAAVAAEKKEPKYKDIATKQRASVGAKCAKALERLQEVMEAEKWQEALKELKNAEASEKTCISDYEKTQVWKFMGYVYYSLDDFNNAIRSYKKVIDGIGTPEEVRLDTRYTIAQLYTAQEQYANAAEQLEIWMKAATVVGADAKVLLAQIYYQLNRRKDSLNLVEEAISDYESKGKLPKEGWWGLQRVLYYEKNNYKKVVNILEQLVKHYPKWSYWRQLGGMYGELERDIDRLVATEVSYLNGQLDKENQVMALGYMYLGAEIPYRGATIIQKGMDDGIVKKSVKNLEVLGTAWYQARDLNKALSALEDASKKSDQGNLQSRLAGIYLDLGRDKEAYRAAKQAVSKGGVKRPDTNYLVMGNALINLHCYKDAVSAFRQSISKAKDEKSKRYPRQWIQYAETEGNRLQKLREIGAKVPGCSKA